MFFGWMGINNAVRAISAEHSGLMDVLSMPLAITPLVTALTFVLRRPVKRVISGVFPRLAAYTSCFGVVAFLSFARRLHPDWMTSNANDAVRGVGLALWFAGTLVSITVIWSMRDAMSVIPQARRLITTGPFRYARHPLYATYLLTNVGLWLRFNTAPLAVFLLAWLVITVLRVRAEEAVLSDTFPEYAAYRQKTWMFSPRLVPQPRPVPAD